MYTRSRYTLAQAWDDERGVLVNTLSGAIDETTAEIVDFVHRHETFGGAGGEEHTLIERGYYVPSPPAERQIAQWLLTKARRRAQEQLRKYVFSLTLRCNLRCGYCWQVQRHGEARQQSPWMTPEMVEAAFAWIDRDLVQGDRPRQAVVSLFGGEPLMDRDDAHRLVATIGQACRQRGLTLHLASNGKDLAAFAEEIAPFRPSLQVTADGLEGDGSDLCLLRAGQRLEGLYQTLQRMASQGQAGIVLRFLVSPETMPQLAHLADAAFADKKLERNFSLAVAPIQDKAGGRERPPKSVVLQAMIDELKDRVFGRRLVCPDWRSLSLLAGVGAKSRMLPPPNFYHCEANVNLTCFGHDGRTYACFESIGDADWATGAYWPKALTQPQATARFHEHSAFSSPQCAECSLAGLCGGGCVYHHRLGGSPACEDLKAETRVTLRNWRTLAQIFGRTTDDEP